MVLIVTFPRSVSMIRCKEANLKYVNITNTNGAGVAIYGDVDVHCGSVIRLCDENVHQMLM